MVPEQQHGADGSRGNPVCAPGTRDEIRREHQRDPESEERDAQPGKEPEVCRETPALAMQNLAQRIRSSGPHHDHQEKPPRELTRTDDGQKRPGHHQRRPAARAGGEEPLGEQRIVEIAREGAIRPPDDRGRQEGDGDENRRAPWKIRQEFHGDRRAQGQSSYRAPGEAGSDNRTGLRTVL